METDNQEITNPATTSVSSTTHPCSSFGPKGTALVCNECGADFVDKIVEMLPHLNADDLRMQYRNRAVNDSNTEVAEDATEEENREEAIADSEECEEDVEDIEDVVDVEDVEDGEEDSEEDSGDDSDRRSSNSYDSQAPMPYNKYIGGVVRNILPALLIILLRTEGFRSLCVLQFLYRAIRKYGYDVIEEYVHYRVCYKTLNTLYCKTVEATSNTASRDLRVKYFNDISLYLSSIDLDQEKELFEEFLRDRNAAYWNKILIACSAAFIIAYTCALIGVVGYFK